MTSGGTKIEFAIVSDTGELIDRQRTPTDHFKTPGLLVAGIADAIAQLLKDHPDIKPVAVGVGVAGQIEKGTGVIMNAPNLGWKNVPLQQLLTDKLQLPIAICNDVKAEAIGEWKFGAGVSCNNFVCIFIGTGIGGALMVDGKMLEGCNNTAGEVGHTTILMHGPKCHCGNEGCFEALAGGWAIQRDAQAAVQADAAAGKMLLDIANGDVTAINGGTVAAAAQKNDPLAQKLVSNVGEALIAGITSVVNMVGPCRVILGGGVMEGLPQLLAQVQAGVPKFALKAALDSLEILPAKLHNDAGVIGAAAFALQSLKTASK